MGHFIDNGLFYTRWKELDPSVSIEPASHHFQPGIASSLVAYLLTPDRFQLPHESIHQHIDISMKKSNTRQLFINDDIDRFLMSHQYYLEVYGSPEGMVETDELSSCGEAV